MKNDCNTVLMTMLISEQQPRYQPVRQRYSPWSLVSARNKTHTGDMAMASVGTLLRRSSAILISKSHLTCISSSPFHLKSPHRRHLLSRFLPSPLGHALSFPLLSSHLLGLVLPISLSCTTSLFTVVLRV